MLTPTLHSKTPCPAPTPLLPPKGAVKGYKHSSPRNTPIIGTLSQENDSCVLTKKQTAACRRPSLHVRGSMLSYDVGERICLVFLFNLASAI